MGYWRPARPARRAQRRYGTACDAVNPDPGTGPEAACTPVKQVIFMPISQWKECACRPGMQSTRGWQDTWNRHWTQTNMTCTIHRFPYYSAIVPGEQPGISTTSDFEDRLDSVNTGCAVVKDGSRAVEVDTPASQLPLLLAIQERDKSRGSCRMSPPRLPVDGRPPDQIRGQTVTGNTL